MGTAGRGERWRRGLRWGTAGYILALSLVALLPNTAVGGTVQGAMHLTHVLSAPPPGPQAGPVVSSTASPAEILRKSGDVLQYVVLWILLLLQMRGSWRAPVASALAVLVSLVNEAEHLLAPARVFEGNDVLLVAGVLSVLALLAMVWDQTERNAGALLDDGTGR